MKEFVELLIPEANAQRFLSEKQGVRLSDTWRKLIVSTNDPLFYEIGKISRIFEETNQEFFYGWNFIRKYSAVEIQSAKLFHMMINAVFEPSGEECGTVYDESTACKICEAGRTQVSDLLLDLRKVPKKKGIARTIADEWIISQRLAELLLDYKITGFELKPVRHQARYQDDPKDPSQVPSGRKLLKVAQDIGITPDSWEYYVWLNRPEQYELCMKVTEEYCILQEKKSIKREASLPLWYQLVITSKSIQTKPPTRFGIDPFDDDQEGSFRCPLGHVSGLNLLSELWLTKEDWDGSDFCRTKDMVGASSGVLVPKPLLIISARLYQLLEIEKIKGYKVEIAHIK